MNTYEMLKDLAPHERVAARKAAREALYLTALSRVSPNAEDHVYARRHDVTQPSLDRYLKLMNEVPEKLWAGQNSVFTRFFDLLQDEEDLHNIHLARQIAFQKKSRLIAIANANRRAAAMKTASC